MRYGSCCASAGHRLPCHALNVLRTAAALHASLPPLDNQTGICTEAKAIEFLLADRDYDDVSREGPIKGMGRHSGSSVSCVQTQSVDNLARKYLQH